VNVLILSIQNCIPSIAWKRVYLIQHKTFQQHYCSNFTTFLQYIWNVVTLLQHC